jgi:aminotransferase
MSCRLLTEPWFISPEGITLATTEARSTRIRAALAKRIEVIRAAGESPFFMLLGLAEARGGDVITLGRGEPDIPTPPHIVEAAKRALDQGHTTYTNPAGMPALREAIAEKLRVDNNLSYDPASEIIVTTGAQEAIAVVMQTMLNPGDEVLLAAPYYSAYEANVQLAGGVPVAVPTVEQRAFQMEPAEVEARITPRTKLLAIVTPANPTAAALTRDTIEGLADVARRRDLAVLSDELYEKVVYDGFEHVSIASLDGMRDRSIVINGFSKAYSMTGFRIGYMAGPADYVKAALEPRHSLSISSPTPFQHAALAALTGPQDFLAEMMAEYTERRNMMARTFDELGVTYSLPRGAFYFWANISGAGVSSLEFCKRAVSEHGILFFPGSMYGPEGEGYIRISFLAPRDQLQIGLERFAAAYRASQASV